ncbi:DUF4229 domain-containing protein [Catenulispora subtropica]|uniref:DUF202 domain-containing protein n=1 Tax=Catenulispora subtropica TaxID=450798 RepID=A0ABN2RXR4_9ACTN
MPADNKTAAQTAAAGTPDLEARLVSASAKHATLRYATLRIAIFIVSLGVLWGVVAATGHIVTGAGALYLMMGALLVSGVASFFLLSRQRDAMSEQVTARTEKLAGRFQANAALEDED